jgi:hypothetical protein
MGVFGGYTRWAVVFLIIFVLFFLLCPTGYEHHYPVTTTTTHHSKVSVAAVGTTYPAYTAPNMNTFNVDVGGMAYDYGSPSSL